MRRLLIRPGAIGDCILAFPGLEYLIADFTEVWIPSTVVPLVRFARCSASARFDWNRSGWDWRFDDAGAPETSGFKASIQSSAGMGRKRPEFRNALESLGVECHFYPALPAKHSSEHVTDFFAGQVGAPEGLVPRIDLPPAPPRNAVVIHPFSGSPRKNWPLDSYRELAARLRLRVEWTAGPEEELPEAIRFTNLAELGSWIRGASAVYRQRFGDYSPGRRGRSSDASFVWIPVTAQLGAARR